MSDGKAFSVNPPKILPSSVRSAYLAEQIRKAESGDKDAKHEMTTKLKVIGLSEKVKFNAIMVDSDYLVYNEANGRLNEWDDFSKKREENMYVFAGTDRTQQEAHNILLELVTGENGKSNLINDIITEGEITHPLFVTHDGVVIDGNRRLRAHRENAATPDLEYSTRFIPVYICSPTYTQAQLKGIESVCSHKKDAKIEWSNESKALDAWLAFSIDCKNIEKAAKQHPIYKDFESHSKFMESVRIGEVIEKFRKFMGADCPKNIGSLKAYQVFKNFAAGYKSFLKEGNVLAGNIWLKVQFQRLDVQKDIPSRENQYDKIVREGTMDTLKWKEEMEKKGLLPKSGTATDLFAILDDEAKKKNEASSEVAVLEEDNIFSDRYDDEMIDHFNNWSKVEKKREIGTKDKDVDLEFAVEIVNNCKYLRNHGDQRKGYGVNTASVLHKCNEALAMLNIITRKITDGDWGRE